MIFTKNKLRLANFLGNFMAAIIFPSDQISCNNDH